MPVKPYVALEIDPFSALFALVAEQVFEIKAAEADEMGSWNPVCSISGFALASELSRIASARLAAIGVLSQILRVQQHAQCPTLSG